MSVAVAFVPSRSTTLGCMTGFAMVGQTRVGLAHNSDESRHADQTPRDASARMSARAVSRSRSLSSDFLNVVSDSTAEWWSRVSHAAISLTVDDPFWVYLGTFAAATYAAACAATASPAVVGFSLAGCSTWCFTQFSTWYKDDEDKKVVPLSES
eukprot:TRINITY_DN109907_c0_g1_i1.p1 TRINITY_DN109907_c0_g1~~TRINITY_DN109907_c0_g1_i1.p1  ORF type:complete len:154 (-),score=23.33 TRINITY_DN109907_c0_g1_i1:213-674(-)